MKPYRVFVTLTAATFACAIGLSIRTHAQAGPPPPPNVRLASGAITSGPAGLLGRDDFAYIGFYDVQTAGTDSPYGQALTFRRVGGQLRFLTLDWNGSTSSRVLTEFVGDGPLGSTLATVTNRWRIGMLGDFSGIWWDESRQVLWSSSGPDYTADFYPTAVAYRGLNADGTISNERGPFILNGIPAKRAYGGVQRVPAWFQAQYGTGPYMTGWGGYTSLVAQGGGASQGMACYIFPDPAALPNGAVINNFKTCGDHVSGNRTEDWYKLTGAKTPSSFDRGTRVSAVQNYFDAGDPRQNPNSPPTGPTVGNWLSPAPDGRGRWTWGDSYYNTCNWIETSSKKGFVCVASLAGGKAWYQSSTLAFDKRVAEIHVFDPDRMGQVVQGSLQPWAIQPSNLWEVSLPGLGGPFPTGGNNTKSNAAAASYDAASGRLYIMGFEGGGTYVNRIYVFQVAQ